ncbi:unnamed protein product, partial [Symbiodinium sp. CCMP2592]
MEYVNRQKLIADRSRPVPTDRALLFLDNHDQQRERWKPEVPGQPPSSPVCFWD